VSGIDVIEPDLDTLGDLAVTSILGDLPGPEPDLKQYRIHAITWCQSMSRWEVGGLGDRRSVDLATIIGELTSGIFLPSFKVLVPKGISIE
jgi:hypothetical protein